MRSRSEQHFNARAGKWQTAGFLLELQADQPVDWAELFPAGRTKLPVEVEIGIGKGTFLLQRAKQRPEVNLLGVEYARAYAAYSADRLRRAGLVNAKVICCDAGPLVEQFPDASVQRVFILFPDPWPKRKHHRRRLIQVSLFRELWRKLMIGGQLVIVTDHAGYFRHIRRAADLVEGFLQTEVPELSEDANHVTGTNFEVKYAREGRTIHKIALMKYPYRGLGGCT